MPLLRWSLMYHPSSLLPEAFGENWKSDPRKNRRHLTWPRVFLPPTGYLLLEVIRGGMWGEKNERTAIKNPNPISSDRLGKKKPPIQVFLSSHKRLGIIFTAFWKNSLKSAQLMMPFTSLRVARKPKGRPNVISATMSYISQLGWIPVSVATTPKVNKRENHIIWLLKSFDSPVSENSSRILFVQSHSQVSIFPSIFPKSALENCWAFWLVVWFNSALGYFTYWTRDSPSSIGMIFVFQTCKGCGSPNGLEIVIRLISVSVVYYRQHCWVADN